MKPFTLLAIFCVGKGHEFDEVGQYHDDHVCDIQQQNVWFTVGSKSRDANDHKAMCLEDCSAEAQNRIAGYQCTDDTSVTDTRGKSCADYANFPNACGMYDSKGSMCQQMGSYAGCNGDFEASKACCACQSEEQ